MIIIVSDNPRLGAVRAGPGHCTPRGIIDCIPETCKDKRMSWHLDKAIHRSYQEELSCHTDRILRHHSLLRYHQGTSLSWSSERLSSGTSSLFDGAGHHLSIALVKRDTSFSSKNAPWTHLSFSVDRGTFPLPSSLQIARCSSVIRALPASAASGNAGLVMILQPQRIPST